MLWCAAATLNRYDPGTFARFTAKDGLGDPVTDASVNSIERDADGHLWFGSGWKGAFRMDGKKLGSPIYPGRRLEGSSRR